MSPVSELEAARRWLEAYGSAWEARDPGAAAELFTEDASYAWGPFEEPLRGRDAIRRRWDEATAVQRNVRFASEVLGVVDAGAVARWWCAFDAGEGHIELEGIFLVSLTVDELCSDFREWWNERASTPND